LPLLSRWAKLALGTTGLRRNLPSTTIAALMVISFPTEFPGCAGITPGPVDVLLLAGGAELASLRSARIRHGSVGILPVWAIRTACVARGGAAAFG